MSASTPEDGGKAYGRESFRTTQWSAVLLASDLEASGAGNALARLCADYWYPLYAYIRRRGYSAPDAEDLTQEFFHRLLARNILEGITRDGGKFRSFLLTAVNHFLTNEWQRGQAQKRGGGQSLLSLDADPEDRYKLEPADNATPERLFEKRWAFAVLDQAMRSLDREYTAKNKGALFARLHPSLFASDRAETFAEIGRSLRFSEEAVKTAASRLRKRFGEILRAEIGRTVSDPAAIPEELRHLFAVSAAFGYSYAPVYR